MPSRLKILACSQVERNKDNILNEVQIQIVDIVTNKKYNVECHLLNDDYYEISVCEVLNTHAIDLIDGNFDWNDDLGLDIITLVIDYFIIPF